MLLFTPKCCAEHLPPLALVETRATANYYDPDRPTTQKRAGAERGKKDRREIDAKGRRAQQEWQVVSCSGAAIDGNPDHSAGPALGSAAFSERIDGLMRSRTAWKTT
jgi:hypothetical protein